MDITKDAQRIIDEYEHLIQPNENALAMARLWVLLPEIRERLNEAKWGLAGADWATVDAINLLLDKLREQDLT